MSKGYTISTINRQLLPPRGLVQYLIKCTSQKRAVELLELTNTGRWSVYMFRLYAHPQNPMSTSQAEVTCDAKEGVWWKPLDHSTDADYKEIWSSPLNN